MPVDKSLILPNAFNRQELARSSSPVVRNNIMVALSDMVITYTALVGACVHTCVCICMCVYVRSCNDTQYVNVHVCG